MDFESFSVSRPSDTEYSPRTLFLTDKYIPDLDKLDNASKHWVLNFLEHSVVQEKVSRKIQIITDINHPHTGYRAKDGRYIIYERRPEIEKILARQNYLVYKEKVSGRKSLKSDEFFSDIRYGECLSKAFNFIANNKKLSKVEIQKNLDEIFARWIK